MQHYSRDLSPGHGARAEALTERHVREHLSSVCHPDDDGEAYAHEVSIVRTPLDGGGLRLTGSIAREPVADYLRDDFDPEGDVARNPLSVPSIEDVR
ncbi:MAG TPA: hypothetical protein VF069_18755 [Streptosporangiaceae bacterium]